MTRIASVAAVCATCLLPACLVDGDPVGPEPCLTVIHITFDTAAVADSAVVVDSVTVEPDCEE